MLTKGLPSFAPEREFSLGPHAYYFQPSQYSELDTIINHNQVLLFELLTSCTSLEICKLRYNSPFGRCTNGTELLRTLSSLLDLSLNMEKPDTLLQWMVLPRLRRLRWLEGHFTLTI